MLDYFDNIDKTNASIFHVCGYENNDTILTQHAYRVITGANKGIFEFTQNESCGAFWNGEEVYLKKLLKGQIINPQFIPVDNLSIRMQNSSEMTIPKAIVINTEGIELYSVAKIAFEYDKKISLENNCYAETKNCDILIGLIGSRFGSKAGEMDFSISMQEMKNAIDNKKQVYICILKKVL